MFILDTISEQTIKIEPHPNESGWGQLLVPRESYEVLGQILSQVWFEDILVFDDGGTRPIALGPARILYLGFNPSSDQYISLTWKIGDELSWEVEGHILKFRKV